jgi:hypothetical protein
MPSKLAMIKKNHTGATTDASTPNPIQKARGLGEHRLPSYATDDGTGCYGNP